jgi:hypothetical protein
MFPFRQSRLTHSCLLFLGGKCSDEMSRPNPENWGRRAAFHSNSNGECIETRTSGKFISKLRNAQETDFFWNTTESDA